MKSIDTQLFKVNMMNHSVNGRDVGELLKFIPTFICMIRGIHEIEVLVPIVYSVHCTVQ